MILQKFAFQAIYTETEQHENKGVQCFSQVKHSRVVWMAGLSVTKRMRKEIKTPKIQDTL